MWITDAVEWQDHCQKHVDNYVELPAQFNQLKYRYTPATAYLCMFCLFNPELPATTRFKQYKNAHYWKEHHHRHFLELEKELEQTHDGSKSVLCPDPRCGLAFDSVDDLRYHSQDSHCCDLLKFSPRGSARSRALSKEDTKSQSVSTGSDNETQMDFINETVETLPSLCLEPFPPEDDTGIKRKRGRPRKLCAVSSGGSGSPAPKGKPSAKSKRGRPRMYGSKPSLASPSMVRGKLGSKETRGRPRRRYSASSTGSSYRSASSQSDDVPYLESENELETSDNESESESDYVFVESSGSYFPQGGYWVSSKRRRKGSHWVAPSRAMPQVVIYDATHTKHTDAENVTPVHANPLMLGKNKETRRDNLVGIGNDANIVIDGDVAKCETCSLLEMQAKSDAELNRVCEAGALALPLPGDVTEAVWVKLEDKNRDGLVRWYPCQGARVGFAVIVNSEGVIEGLRAFAEDGNGEYAGKPFQVQVVYTLAFDTRLGTVKFCSPSKELNGLVACKHFEDIRFILERELENTNSLMDLVSRR